MVRHHSQWRVLDVSATPGSAAESPSRTRVRAGLRADSDDPPARIGRPAAAHHRPFVPLQQSCGEDEFTPRGPVANGPANAPLRSHGGF